MIKYVSRKEVQAEPMNELMAVDLDYARANTDNHEWREGYHVVYPDGYHSWCPKDQFEKANRRAETHVDRLFIEHGELNQKVLNLKDFLFTDTFNSLGREEKELLERQLGAMSSYLQIVAKRIGLSCTEPCCCKE